MVRDDQDRAQGHSTDTTARGAGVCLWGLGIAALVAMLTQLGGRILNVVTYSFADAPWSGWLVSCWPAVAAAGAAAMLAFRRRRNIGEDCPHSTLSAGVPLLATIAVAALWWWRGAPDFVSMCVAFAAVSWSLSRLGEGGMQAAGRGWSAWLAPVLLVLLIVGVTAWHAQQQYGLWRHFMLGYADCGQMMTDMEDCLPWKDVGQQRFARPAMANHCVPLFYTLAPLYAVFRSPIFLMVVGPLAFNVAALAFYRYVRETTRSCWTALAVAVAWLALPSLARLPYSNTYGFQPPYLAVPWLAFAFTLGLQGRWRWSYVCLTAAVLCQETVCGVAFGWGLYLALVERRHKHGLILMGCSAVYLVVATQVIVPIFSGPAGYARGELYGDGGALAMLARLDRPRVGLYLLALMAPLLPSVVRGGRLLLAAAPTLLLVLLLANDDYLNVKYWHQSSVLAILFLAAVVGIVRRLPADGTPHRSQFGQAIALLVGVLLFHQMLASTPLSPSWHVARAMPNRPEQPAREAAVAFVRARFQPDQAIVAATERLGAHFTDYRTVMMLAGGLPANDLDADVALVIDRSDGWDGMISSGGLPELMRAALEADFEIVAEYGPVLILHQVQRPAD